MSKWIKKFKYALNGLWFTLINESSFRVMVSFLVVQIVLGLILGISSTQWIIIILFSSLALCAELFNTACERICDVFTQGWLIREIGVIKDICAGGVAIMSAANLTVTLIIFIPAFLA